MDLEDMREVEENSYVDMSGTNKTTTIASSSTDIETGDDPSQMDPREECNPKFDVMEENSYDLTTDQILYDECQQEVCYEQEPMAPLRSPTPDSRMDENQCPYGGLPASHLRLQQSPKHGTLFKQEKRLFFDQFKKYYVGLIGKWLLIYNSHNDLRPCQTLFIKCIKLDLNLNEQINEKHLFQIITQADMKVHFLSPSFQDLNEWIVAIENNLIEKPDRTDEGPILQAARRLPLPPYCASEDETDMHVAAHADDGIYEEPVLCLKTETETKTKEQTHGYDTPKPLNFVRPDNDSAISKNCSDSPTHSKKPDLPAKAAKEELGSGGASPARSPMKSWIKTRFNRSPPDPIEGKASKKALKKLSFEELSTVDASSQPNSQTATSNKHLSVDTGSKFTLATTGSSKGTKINMIISQLEANGQLNLLSKRLNETNKRYTWVAESVTG
ncbi:uncharacterized protein LOC128720262 [Anopheles nili]|uniref:uncharacterized protein LOC128720262 n=1 Tax=Anopheles nili TaxID=185578 RepID=UPI00237B6FCE|nr:uncharacterized protein LOC128720262 [Anopheles nili]